MSTSHFPNEEERIFIVVDLGSLLVLSLECDKSKGLASSGRNGEDEGNENVRVFFKNEAVNSSGGFSLVQ